MNLFYNKTNTLKSYKEKVGDIMTSLKSFNRRVGSLFAVAALVLATVTPGLVPAFASAAQISERSVELSSSSKGATGVAYTVKFTPSASAGAVVLNFCSNTPLLGATCDVPTGFDAHSATATGYTVARTTAAEADTENNAIVLTGSISAAATTINLEGVTNPSAAAPLYVRIATYDTEAHALLYTDTTVDTTAGKQDTGSAAVSITDSVGVSGAVLETMTFCVAGNVINQPNCTTTDNGGQLKAPTLKLGQTTGDVVALDSNFLSEGNIYSQLSTNAVGGAVVNLRSSTVGCGGLFRAGRPDDTECNIKPALNSGVAAGQAKFGVKTNTAVGVGTSNGTLQPAAGSIYSNSAYALNYVNGDGSGVTGPFGDPFLDTDGNPASNMGMQITFGASIAPNTPAGLYSADLSLIATGKF